MDNRALNYIQEQIAAQGYAITSSKWAAICSPANYGNGQSALSLEGSPVLTATMKHLNTKPYRVNFKEGSMATCWSRSPVNLAQRIEWQIGAAVDEISPIVESEEPIKPPVVTRAEAQARAHRAALRKLAIQNPPAHDCPNRAAILEARKELQQEELNHATK